MVSSLSRPMGWRGVIQIGIDATTRSISIAICRTRLASKYGRQSAAEAAPPRVDQTACFDSPRSTSERKFTVDQTAVECSLGDLGAVSHFPVHNDPDKRRLRRLNRDWAMRYGHEVQLVETFVDRSRFAGTCYRAANWRLLGQTSGRTRQDREHRINARTPSWCRSNARTSDSKN